MLDLLLSHICGVNSGKFQRTYSHPTHTHTHPHTEAFSCVCCICVTLICVSEAIKSKEILCENKK